MERYSAYVKGKYATSIPAPAGTLLSPATDAEHAETIKLPYQSVVGIESQAFISAQHCHTRELWADLFTKNLSSVLFVKFRDGITGYTRDLAIGYEQHEASALFISVYSTSPARIA